MTVSNPSPASPYRPAAARRRAALRRRPPGQRRARHARAAQVRCPPRSIPRSSATARFAAAGGQEGAVVFPRPAPVRDHVPRPPRRPRPLSRPRPRRRDGRPQRRRRVTREVINDVAFIGQIAESVMPDGPLFEVAVIHHTQCGSGRARRRHVPPPLRRADRRRRVDPARARRARPGGDRRAGRRAPRSARPRSLRASPCPGMSTTS